MPRLPEEYAVWMGRLKSPEEVRAQYEVDEVKYISPPRPCTPARHRSPRHPRTPRALAACWPLTPLLTWMSWRAT